MKIHLDTSVLFSLCVPDANSARADEWRRNNPEPIAFSDLHRLELRNALSLAVFQNRMTDEEAGSAWKKVEEDLVAGSLIRKPSPWGRLMREAEALAMQFTPSIGTRSLDIMHVAAALAMEATRFCTFDERQAKLARLAGFQVEP